MIKRNVAVLMAVVVLVLWLPLPRADAVVEFKDGGIHDVAYEIYDNVWVDYEAPGMQTTVNVLPGGYNWLAPHAWIQ